MATRTDFIEVQLTPAAVAFAASSPVRASNGRASYAFTGTSTVEVLTSEWSNWLSKLVTPKGDAMLQTAPTSATATTPSTSAPADTATKETTK
ncbi:hypothetical protein ACFQBQ_07585 [Granulicella cerasi]|uniref:Uncharacterized protein n=1 Tax=Granulicella cerasi TaxID=741063 RepID=A0ABW1Z973_9BACT|nr:hypothetical protein [Granulicella cerasi]